MTSKLLVIFRTPEAYLYNLLIYNILRYNAGHFNMLLKNWKHWAELGFLG